MSSFVKLNPSSLSFLSILPKVDFSTLTVERLRRPSPVLSVPGPEVTIERLEIPCQTDGHLIPVDMYRPASASVDEVLPVVVYL
jgi:acetyl esterase/lipase